MMNIVTLLKCIIESSICFCHTKEPSREFLTTLHTQNFICNLNICSQIINNLRL